jgi:hypothetical protein
MSDEPAKTDALESPESPGQPRSWREDALSVFLIAAALLLGGMYVYDQWQASRIDDQIARADQIGQSFAVDGANCQVSSTGLAGETLVVACPGLAAEKVAELAGTVDTLTAELAHFDAVVFRGAETQLRCPAEPADWVDGCTEESVPAVDPT